MKKVLSLVLCLIMLMSVCISGISAVFEKISLTEYPVIMVAGFTSSELCRIDEETGEVIHVWGDAVGQAGPAVKENIGGIVTDLSTFLLAGNVDPIAKRLGEGFQRIFADLKTNPDGSSYYDVINYINTAEESSYAVLMEKYPDGRHQAEAENMSGVIEAIGAENCFVFTSDLRMGAVYNAENLRLFIDDVLAYTGKDKVNIYGVSHGGQITGTYLALYGSEGKVNNAVLTIPALGGAGLAYDAFNYKNGGFSFGEVGLLIFIQHGFMIEEDLQYLVEAEYLGFLDDLANALVPYVMPILGTWGSLWDFIPIEHYDALKAELLDEEINAGLIEQSDFVHYEIMSPDGDYYYAKTFKEAQNEGTNIYIVAGYDIQVVTGMAVSSDALIPTSAATGATCAPLGERFADGYTQAVDYGFNQISPTMTVDASTGYLPEHTWYIQDYHHGMTYKDEFTRELVYTLLLNDESYDVHSFERFPQFHATTNPSHAVHAQFDVSKEGYVSSQDNALIVKNICADNNVMITAISVKGTDDISFGITPVFLKPGESKAISFNGEFEEVSLSNFEISISYIIGNLTPVGQRTFDFVIMNGEAAEFDAENPFVPAGYDNGLEDTVGSGTVSVLEKFGVKTLTSIIYDVIMKFYTVISEFVASFIK